MVREVSEEVAFMPATLKMKSRFDPVRERISATRKEREERESGDEMLHSMMWMFLFVLRLESSEVSFDLERTAAMILLVGWEESWRTNSRPMPRLAPVRK